MKSKNNGITLIALIITIIVMLILVAVTINMAVNGGLFGYAGNAAKDTELAKQKELDWLNTDGMTTDQLITKYTTDSERDLEILRLLLPYFYDIEDTSNLTSEEIEELTLLANTLETDMNNGELVLIREPGEENYGIWKYHGVYYKVVVTFVNEEPTSLTVEPYTPNEIDLAYEVSGFGEELVGYYTNNDDIYNAFYNYNDKTYKIVSYSNSGVIISMEDFSSKVAVISVDNSNYYGSIEFELSNPNITWYQWATDPNNNIDLDLSDWKTGETLKSVIITSNGAEDKVIDCVGNLEYVRNHTTSNSKSTDYIIIGGVYKFGTTR